MNVNYNMRRAARNRVDMNALADALADGLTVPQAAVRIGRTERTCRKYLVAICRGLGAQAV